MEKARRVNLTRTSSSDDYHPVLIGRNLLYHTFAPGETLHDLFLKNLSTKETIRLSYSHWDERPPKVSWSMAVWENFCSLSTLYVYDRIEGGPVTEITIPDHTICYGSSNVVGSTTVFLARHTYFDGNDWVSEDWEVYLLKKVQ